MSSSAIKLLSLSQNNIKIELQTIYRLTCSKDTTINGSIVP